MRLSVVCVKVHVRIIVTAVDDFYMIFHSESCIKAPIIGISKASQKWYISQKLLFDLTWHNTQNMPKLLFTLNCTRNCYKKPQLNLNFVSSTHFNDTYNKNYNKIILFQFQIYELKFSFENNHKIIVITQNSKRTSMFGVRTNYHYMDIVRFNLMVNWNKMQWSVQYYSHYYGIDWLFQILIVKHKILHPKNPFERKIA